MPVECRHHFHHGLLGEARREAQRLHRHGGRVHRGGALNVAQERAPSVPAPARRPLTITLLGTGTPAPSLTRQSSGYLIEVGSDLIVWDHGPGAHQRLIESGHRSIDTNHAFFTHLHYDHCMDYGRLVLQRWDQGADRIADLQGLRPAADRPDDRAAVRRRRHLRPRHPRPRRAPQQPRLFEARGGKVPRRRPAPKVTEIHAGSVD